MGKVSEYVEAVRKADAMKPRVFYRMDDTNTWAASFDEKGLLHFHIHLEPLGPVDTQRLLTWLTENI